MAEIENGYYYIEDGVVLKEDGYTNSVDKVGKVVGFDYEQEIRTKVIEEFSSLIAHYIDLNGADGKLEVEISEIFEIAESMKGEK